MTEKMKNILVGTFVMAALAIAIAMVLFLEPKIGDGRKILKVRFTNISGITIGTRVSFAGKPVGEVVQIKEVEHARLNPPDSSGKVYLYELTLKIDSKVDVFNTDEISMKTTGLMGERSIAILPKANVAGEKSYPVKEEVLYANSIDVLENTFHQVSKVANRMDEMTSHLDHWFGENQQTLTHSTQSMEKSLYHLGNLLESVEKLEVFSSFKESLDLMNQNLYSLEKNQTLQSITSVALNLDRALDSFHREGTPILANLNQLSFDLAHGNGTIGKLITGQDFYLRFNGLLSKAETLMNDINHYGLLFQYDKGWQRSRTKRANLLKAIDSPKEFRAYFEGEVDHVTTSLGRLSELLDKVKSFEAKEKMKVNADFRREFSALLRSAESLTGALKLYSQELSSHHEE